MLAQELEIRGGGDEVKLVNHINTDEHEKLNWERTQAGKGFSPGKEWRCAVSIPILEAMSLWAVKDIDWLAWNENGDEAAFQRLLKRYPHWRCAEGGI